MTGLPSAVRSQYLISLTGLLLLTCLAACAPGVSSRASGGSINPPTLPAAAPDADDDGYPDRAELRSDSDRENFRRWFTAIAEAQFYAPSEAWNTEQRDCAGLVRFAVREALRPHDRPWHLRVGPGYTATAPDVRALKLGAPPLGEKIFRTDFGSYREGDVEAGKFSEFADARTLKTYNTAPVGRDRRAARPGDLLFFHQPWVQKYPYHVMIFLGEPREQAEGASDWVVYHTGSSPEDREGKIKRVRLAVLDRHPDPRWRPIEANRNFLGFYRLRFLE